MNPMNQVNLNQMQMMQYYSSQNCRPNQLPTIWMQKPLLNGLSVTPGLEYLSILEKLTINPAPNATDLILGWDFNHKYRIKNAAGEQVYFSLEVNDMCHRIWCPANRDFIMHIVDNLNQEAIKITRFFKVCGGNNWCAGCCDGCAHEVVVEAPPGNVIGYGSFMQPKFDVLDKNLNRILFINGPSCILNSPACPCTNEFKVFNLQGTQIGNIIEYIGGYVDLLDNSRSFGITFPIDLSVNSKALLIGALFLIDIMFFEDVQN